MSAGAVANRIRGNPLKMGVLCRRKVDLTASIGRKERRKLRRDSQQLVWVRIAAQNNGADMRLFGTKARLAFPRPPGRAFHFYESPRCRAVGTDAILLFLHGFRR